uniref:Formate dehydrogenase, subunit FdhD n=1 Tax=Aurantimonas manganoxydans TaxID=651183 RepID=A0A0P0Z5Z0_9HYPH|nr:formate dehydrogenase, subunit FdhD [Aurantimonas manganoxydans SI85-9A1]
MDSIRCDGEAERAQPFTGRDEVIEGQDEMIDRAHGHGLFDLPRHFQMRGAQPGRARMPDIASDRHSPKGGLLITGTQPHRAGTAAEA